MVGLCVWDLLVLPGHRAGMGRTGWVVTVWPAVASSPLPEPSEMPSGRN